MNDGWSSFCLLLTGIVYFPLIYTAARYLLTKFFKHRLSTGDICLISEKCTCSIQALMSFAVGLTIVLEVDDIMHDTHWLTNTYAWFALPYFASDLRAMHLTFVWNRDAALRSSPLLKQLRVLVRSRPLMLVHHTLLPAIIFPAIILFRHDLGDFFVGAFYMIEVTIPFISARAIMVQLNLKNTPYYIVVGLLMLFSFFLSRILIFPCLFWRYSVYADVNFLAVPGRIPVKCTLGCLLILLPQLYWFGLMLRGTVRVFYKVFIQWRSKSRD